MAPDDAPPQPPRLNPFLLTSHTDFRFILLVVSVLAATIFAYQFLTLRPLRFEFQALLADCLAVYESLPADPDPDPGLIGAAGTQSRAFEICIEPFEQRQALWILGGLGLVLGAAAAFFWLLPWVRIRRDRLLPLLPEDDPELHAALLDLIPEAGLRRPPRFLAAPLNPTVGGEAFGRPGDRIVALTGGLLVKFYENRPQFRAIVLHEMAHLRNDDLDKSFFSLSLWLAFLVFALIPLAGSLLLNTVTAGGFDFELRVIWRALFFIIFTYLMLVAVFRAREFYADIRASTWTGSLEPLRATFDQDSAPAGPLWQRLFRFHPAHEDRRRLLHQTDELFRLSAGELIGCGVAGAIAVPELHFLLTVVLDSDRERLAPFIASALIALLMAGIACSGIWQAVFGGLVLGQPASLPLRSGLLLGGGFLAGLFLAPTTAVDLTLGESDLFLSAGRFLFYVVWGGLLLVSLAVFWRWVADGASAWLRRGRSPASLRRIFTTGWLLTGAAWAAWLGVLLALQALEGLPFFFAFVLAPAGFIDFITSQPFLMPALLLLAAFPFLPRLWPAGGRPEPAGWAFLEPRVVPTPSLAVRDVPLGGSLLQGLAAAGIVLFLASAVHLVLHQVVPFETRLDPDWQYGVSLTKVLLAFLAQGSLAFFITLRGRPLGWSRGLLAAFTAGLVIAVGLVALVEVGDCLSFLSLGARESCRDFIDLEQLANVYRAVGRWGFFVSFLAALAASVPVLLFQALRSSKADLPPPRSRDTIGGKNNET